MTLTTSLYREPIAYTTRDLELYQLGKLRATLHVTLAIPVWPIRWFYALKAWWR